MTKKKLGAYHYNIHRCGKSPSVFQAPFLFVGTFKELAQKRGINITFLGELIADHCRKLEG